MDLTNQTQIQIQNKIFTLGSPVTHVNTLDKLLYVFQQMGISERPIVIINPVDDSLPDLANLLENYIENAMQGFVATSRPTYLFQGYTDEQILEWANSQYKPGSGTSLDYLIESGKAIREQSRLRCELDRLNSRKEELWRQHCLNPESEAGSAEYSDLSYNQIPRVESELKEVTDCLGRIPRDLDLGSVYTQSAVEDVPVENVENPVEIISENVDKHDTGEMVGMRKPDLILSNPSNLLMPLSVAKQIADSPQNQVFREQQSVEVPGYATVPLEYLIALGIQLYADGVPIVFTKSGGFRRIGNSSVNPVVVSYWYPTPRYK